MRSYCTRSREGEYFTHLPNFAFFAASRETMRLSLYLPYAKCDHPYLQGRYSSTRRSAAEETTTSLFPR